MARVSGDYTMSGYGPKEFNPEERKRQWVNSCKVRIVRATASSRMLS